MRSPLSVIVITRDEAKDLPECLASVQVLGPEIVVVDSGSTDGTPEVARHHGAKVYKRTFKDYADQKQAALEKAAGTWVLSLDADERLSPELAAEIEDVLRSRVPEGGFEIPFQVHFMGRRLRFGGLGSERHLRLFRRKAGRFVGGELHEGVKVFGRVGRLRGVIRHVPYRDLDDYFAKASRYTTLAARKRRAQGRRFTPWHHLLPFWEFFVRSVLRLGALDGTPGLVWAALASFHTWMKYLKLREMDRRNGSSPLLPQPPVGGFRR